MAVRIDESSAQLEPTDELPVLSHDVVRQFDAAVDQPDPEGRSELNHSIDALRDALERAESRWEQLETRLAAQDQAIAELRDALGNGGAVTEPEIVPTGGSDALSITETDATAEFRFMLDAEEDENPEDSVGGELEPDAALTTDSETANHDALDDAEPTTRVPELTEIVAGMEKAASAADYLLGEAAEPEPHQDTRDDTSEPDWKLADSSSLNEGMPSERSNSAEASLSIPDAPGHSQPGLLEHIAALEAYIDGRAAKWQAMESQLDEQSAKISELELELQQRVDRENNLEQRLHLANAKAKSLNDRLRNAHLSRPGCDNVTAQDTKP